MLYDLWLQITTSVTEKEVLYFMSFIFLGFAAILALIGVVEVFRFGASFNDVPPDANFDEIGAFRVVCLARITMIGLFAYVAYWAADVVWHASK